MMRHQAKVGRYDLEEQEEPEDMEWDEGATGPYCSREVDCRFMSVLHPPRSP